MLFGWVLFEFAVFFTKACRANSLVVQIGRHYYRQQVGIPQGSILSTVLCSFFYGDLETRDERLRDLRTDPGSVSLCMPYCGLEPWAYYLARCYFGWLTTTCSLLPACRRRDNSLTWWTEVCSVRRMPGRCVLMLRFRSPWIWLFYWQR